MAAGFAYSFADDLEEQARAGGRLPKGERTRLRLKAAAARILDRKGYRDMQIAEVAEEAGHSVGGIYKHFKNKQELVLEVVSAFIQRNLELAPEVAGARDAFAKIYLSNLFYVELFRANVGLMRCVRQLSDELPAFRSLWLESNGRWFQVIAAGIRKATQIETPEGDASYFAAHALGNMVDEFLHDLYIREDSDLRALRDVPEEVALNLSLVWYRAVYLKAPTAQQVRDALNHSAKRDRVAAGEETEG